jgi:ribokinase
LAVLGSINRDLVTRTVRAPLPGETVIGGPLERLSGGKGANQAIAAHRLGASVRFLGAVGEDEDGRSLVAHLADVGVDTTGIQIVDTPTGAALIVLDEDGENSIIVSPGANHRIDATRLTIGPDEALLAQLEVPIETVEAVAARTTGFVAVNVSPAQTVPNTLVTRIDLCIVNETELDSLPQLKSAPLLALTLGARGAVLYRHGQEVARSSSSAETVVNTVGAGDAFAAALTVGLLRGDDEATALHRACAVGAAAVADPLSQPALRPLDFYGWGING